MNIFHIWCSCMLDWQALDKENVSPRPTSRPNHKKPQVNKVLVTSQKKKKWKYQAFEEAIDEVEKGTCSFRGKVNHGTY